MKTQIVKRNPNHDTEDGLICGTQIQYDNSGVGHNWRNINADDIPVDHREEIACEIIDGKKDTCELYVSGGTHYRW